MTECVTDRHRRAWVPSARSLEAQRWSNTGSPAAWRSGSEWALDNSAESLQCLWSACGGAPLPPPPGIYYRQTGWTVNRSCKTESQRGCWHWSEALSVWIMGKAGSAVCGSCSFDHGSGWELRSKEPLGESVMHVFVKRKMGWRSTLVIAELLLWALLFVIVADNWLDFSSHTSRHIKLLGSSSAHLLIHYSAPHKGHLCLSSITLSFTFINSPSVCRGCNFSLTLNWSFISSCQSCY